MYSIHFLHNYITLLDFQDEIEQRIDEEARRIDRLHPLDAKHNCDQLERDMQMTEVRNKLEELEKIISDPDEMRMQKG